MTGAPGENHVAQSVDDIIHFAIYKLAITALEHYCEVAEPWLALPVARELFESVLDFFGKEFYVFLSQAATFTVIDIQVDHERVAYEQAEQALRLAHASGDSNALKAASDAFDDALARVIHFDGSAR